MTKKNAEIGDNLIVNEQEKGQLLRENIIAAALGIGNGNWGYGESVDFDILK